jgi:GAF domain-containing protein/HAMP domain-containing protein
MRWTPLNSLSFRLNSIIVLTSAVLLAAIVLAINYTAQGPILRTGQERIIQEANLFQGVFGQFGQSLLANTKIMVKSTELVAKLDTHDSDAIKKAVLVSGASLQLDGVDIVDANGQNLLNTQVNAGPDKDKLLSLALLGIETSGLIVEPTGENRLHLATVAPLRDSRSKIVGGILVSRDINTKLLKELSLLRQGIDFVFIHDQNIVEQTLPREGRLPAFDRAAMQQALNGQIVPGNTLVTIDGSTYIMGYAPWQVSGQTDIVVVILFNVSQSVAFQNQSTIGLSYLFVGLMVVIVVVMTLFARKNISLPLRKLQQSVQQLAAGNYQPLKLRAGSHDEIWHLTNAFNVMGEDVYNRETQLRKLTAELERRGNMLQTSIQISQQLTSILDVDQLLQQVVNRIKQSFGYYHVHIYLIDPQTGELVMREGFGEVGRQLKAAGHRLQLGQGIVGKVAVNSEPFLASNVEEVPNFVRNPLLPKTQAELAVPIRKGKDTLGVLDIQNEEKDSFSQEDLILMQSIADQVAIVVENARLFRQTRQAMAAAEKLNRRLTREAWQDISRKIATTGYVFTKNGSTPIELAATSVLNTDASWMSLMTQAVQQKKLVADTDNEPRQQQTAYASVPLVLRDEVIGVISIERAAATTGKAARANENEINPWTEDELATLQTIAAQVALALDSARLAHETQRSAWRDRIVSESTARVWASGEVEEVMRAAVAQLGDRLKASEVVIRLGKSDELLSE